MDGTAPTRPKPEFAAGVIYERASCRQHFTPQDRAYLFSSASRFSQVPTFQVHNAHVHIRPLKRPNLPFFHRGDPHLMSADLSNADEVCAPILPYQTSHRG